MRAYTTCLNRSAVQAAAFIVTQRQRIEDSLHCYVRGLSLDWVTMKALLTHVRVETTVETSLNQIFNGLYHGGSEHAMELVQAGKTDYHPPVRVHHVPQSIRSHKSAHPRALSRAGFLPQTPACQLEDNLTGSQGETAGYQVRSDGPKVLPSESRAWHGECFAVSSLKSCQGESQRFCPQRLAPGTASLPSG